MNKLIDVGLTAAVSTIMIFYFSIRISDAAMVTSTFETGNEGWTKQGMVNVSRPTSGGNPGGFLRFDDAGPDGYRAVAPAKFLGDLSSFLDGSFSFDYKVLSVYDPNPTTYGTVTISSSTDYASLKFIPEDEPMPFSWTTYSRSLDGATWGKTEDQWITLLSNVTSLTIAMEPGGYPDASALDNVKLAPVPLPGAVWLLGSSLVGLVGLRKKFKR